MRNSLKKIKKVLKEANENYKQLIIICHLLGLDKISEAKEIAKEVLNEEKAKQK